MSRREINCILVTDVQSCRGGPPSIQAEDEKPKRLLHLNNKSAE